jgi:hypothetical protein
MSNMSGLQRVAWFRSNDRFVYVRQFASDLRTEVHLVTLNSDGTIASDVLLLTTDSAYGFRDISDLDVARTRDSLLITLNYPTAIRLVEYDLVTNQFTDYVAGMRGHFSSDDSKIVYLDSTRTYVNSLAVASGTTTRLTKKGSFAWTDARP